MGWCWELYLRLMHILQSCWSLRGDFLSSCASDWLRVRAGRVPSLLSEGWVVCHPTPVLLWGSSRSLTVPGDKRANQGGNVIRDMRAAGTVSP